NPETGTTRQRAAAKASGFQLVRHIQPTKPRSSRGYLRGRRHLSVNSLRELDTQTCTILRGEPVLGLTQAQLTSSIEPPLPERCVNPRGVHQVRPVGHRADSRSVLAG